MDKKILTFYKQFGMYTNPGLYQDYLKNDLPDDIKEIGLLMRKSLIHRSSLDEGNTGTNTDLRFGDMTKVPWWRQTEDDLLQTAPAMLAELFRRDKRGLALQRKAENKLILTCRYTAILVASILKSKGIPCRVRSGHADYFGAGKVSADHWINQYWNAKEKRWVTIDVDGSLSMKNENIDPYEVKEGEFDFPAQTWLAIRKKKINPKRFYNAGGVYGAVTVLWALFYDLHSLMNSEIYYKHLPRMSRLPNFRKLTESELKKIDHLAKLMLDPDTNFNELQRIYSTNKEYRLLTGGLL
ncbi:MAG TPA: transglutaminase domain-containing protein [Candidatus Magasanikbacteria bacterium]|nr:transglutaminase domain-containing protein [Candidatus Magasanikbacteria bacterium]